MKRMTSGVLIAIWVALLTACGGAPAATAPTDAPAVAALPATAAPAPTAAPTATAAPVPTSAPAPTVALAATAPTATYSATDATDTTITLSAPAQRIVCTATPCVDMMQSLGIEPVAISDSIMEVAAAPEFFGEQAKSFALIGGSFDEPNLEDIVAAKPDLVIGWGGDQPSLRVGLGAIPVFYINTLVVADAFKELRSVAALTGRTDVAEAAITHFQNRLQAYQSKVTDKPSVVAISGGDVNFELLTDQSLPGNLLSMVADYPFPLPAGVQSYGGSVAYSMEELLKKDPVVVLAVTPAWAGEVEPLSKQLAVLPLWKELKAVQTKRIYDAPREWGNTGGVRGLEAMLDQAMPLIYPDIFPAPLP